MPPKPQVFKTPDGKEFSSRAEWRDYMMATFYSFKNKVDEAEPLIKTPGVVDGQMFDIADCKNSTLVILDHTEQIQIDQLTNCRVFVGACASSIFIRNCSNCVFYTCCRQLRLREVTDSTFYIYSMAEVHIEYSNTLKFAPFNGGYPEHAKHLATANLDIKHNLWYDIYDHNDPAKTHANWSLLPEAEYEAPWFPAGACEPAVPRTKPGAVNRPEAAENMQSFSLQQMMADAQKISSTPAAAPAAAPAPVVVPPPAPAVVAPVVAAAPASPEETAVTEIIKAFVSIKAGVTLAGIVSADFTLALPNGQIATAAEVEVTAPATSNEFAKMRGIHFSKGGDMAYTSFWAKESGASVLYTAVLVKDSAWVLAQAHKSAPTA